MRPHFSCRCLTLAIIMGIAWFWTTPASAQDAKPLVIQGELTAKDVALTPSSAIAAQPPPAAKADPAVVAYNEGAALFNDGKKAEAAAKFEQAVTTRPDLIAGWEALAKVSVDMKAYQKAITSANKALELAPDETDMYGVLYTAYTATGDKAKAAEAKKKLPANAGQLFNDAAKAINSGKDADAEPLLKQAIAADDKFSIAYYELGMLYVRAGKNADDAATAKEMLKYVK